MRSLLRLIGLHSYMKDAHRAGADRLKNKKTKNKIRVLEQTQCAVLS